MVVYDWTYELHQRMTRVSHRNIFYRMVVYLRFVMELEESVTIWFTISQYLC